MVNSLPKKLMTVDQLEWDDVMRQLKRINDIVDASDEDEWETVDDKIKKLYENPIFDKCKVPDQRTDKEKLNFIDAYLQRKQKQRQDKERQDKERKEKVEKERQEKCAREKRERERERERQQTKQQEKSKQKMDTAHFSGYSSAPLTKDEYNLLTQTDYLTPKRVDTFDTTPPTPPHQIVDDDFDY